MIQYKTVLKKFPSKTKKGEFEECYMAAPSRMNIVDERELGDRLQSATSLHKADVVAVITALFEEIETALYNGNTVRLGEIGSFYISISSEKCETPQDVTPSKVKAKRICFRASNKMRKKLVLAHFKKKYKE